MRIRATCTVLRVNLRASGKSRRGSRKFEWHTPGHTLNAAAADRHGEPPFSNVPMTFMIEGILRTALQRI